MSNPLPPPPVALALLNVLERQLGEEKLRLALVALVGIASKTGAATHDILGNMARVCLQSPWVKDDTPDEVIGLNVVGGLTSKQYPWQCIMNTPPGENPWDVLRDAADRLEATSKNGTATFQTRHHDANGRTLSVHEDDRPSPN